jgi:hypothetical protein
MYKYSPLSITLMMKNVSRKIGEAQKMNGQLGLFRQSVNA